MNIEVILASATTLLGFIGIVIGLRLFLSRKGRSISIKVKIGDTIVEVNGVKKEDVSKVLEKLTLIEQAEPEKKVRKDNGQEGYASVEALLLIVPGIIALLFAGTFIYLIITNQGNPNYSTPKELSAAMTTIIGYYFGIGASSAINKGKIISIEEWEKSHKEKIKP